MIDALVLHNYSLPNDYVEINEDTYPVTNFTTEVDVRFNERNKTAQHGIWIGNTFYGQRKLHMEGEILAKNSEEYNDARRKLLRVLMPKSHLRPRQPMGYVEIWFTGFPDKVTAEHTLDGYPEIPLEALSPARSSFQLNLKMFDPRFYGSERIDSMFPPQIGGRSYNKTYNKTYVSQEVEELDVDIINYGDIEVHPIVDFYGPYENPEIIRRDVDGSVHSLKLQGLTLSSTDIVQVDFAKNTAKNIVTEENVYEYKQGEWWTLEPGSNTVRTNAFSSTSASKAVLRWRDGYMV